MRSSALSGAARLSRAEQVGVFVALANGPLTFQRTLMPRATRDQGLVTGLATAANYGIAAFLQDSIEATAGRAVGRDAPDERATLLADLAAMAVGFGLERALAPRPGEPLRRGAARTAAHWVGVAGFSGSVVGVLERALARRGRAGSPAVALGGGVGMAVLLAYRRRRREQADDALPAESSRASAARAAGIGLGVGVFVAGVAAVERVLARAAGSAFGAVLPGSAGAWRPAGHLWALSALGIPAYGLARRSFARIEAGAARVEPAFDRPPADPLVSGSPDSLVPWESLARQGRRNVSTTLRRAWIEAVMGEPAIDPIRVYVGLRSAPTEAARVDLAMCELERTGAFERPLLLVVSPTGTGYVSYAAAEATEYLARGNMATVTIQYSLRPSVLSVGRVGVGHRQAELLLRALRDRVRDRGGPRVVLFGESLGAWASQRAFEGGGTAAPLELGVDRALWAGTPLLSRWRREVLERGGPRVEAGVAGSFGSVAEIRALPFPERTKLRYVFADHHEDPVPRFGPELLVRAPDWLGPPGARPPGVPASETWQTPTTFLQTLVDIKNSVDLAPGVFEARGHDYRGDLAGFVREAYGLDASDEQLARVQEALRRFETARAAWIAGHAGQGHA